VGLIGGAAFPNRGFALRSTAYEEGQYAWPNVPNGRLYLCVQDGTTGPLEPQWPDADGGTVADGTVVWEEQTKNMLAGEIPEPAGGDYERQPWPCTAAAVAATGSTVSNAARMEFPLAAGDWGPIWGVAFYEGHGPSGSALAFFPLATPKVVGESDQIAFPAGAIQSTHF
jgi:hypothetical protein